MKYAILTILAAGFFFIQPCNAQPVEIPLYGNNSLINKDSKSENRIYDQAGELTHISNVAIPRLLVYKPDCVCGTAIIICPGGGYRRLNVENTRFIATRLNRMGITVFVLVYRLPADITPPDKSIVALQDVQTAFKLIRNRAAEWGLSSDKIGLWGSSAGGHLAAMAATHHSTSYISEVDTIGLRPDFLILAWPVISFRPGLVNKGSMENLLGKNPPELQIADNSPDECVNARTPATFIVQADDDAAVKTGNSIRFYECLKKAGVPAELHIYEKGGHGFGIAPDVRDSWMSQLEIWMRNKGLIDENIHQDKLLKPDKSSLLKTMEHVANWQIANHDKSKVHDLKWNNSVFYMGLMELSKISKDSSYSEWLLKMGSKYNWQPHSRMYMADDISVSQMYLDMYRLEGDKRMLTPTYARTEWIINHPSTSDFLYDPSNDKQTERWCWCDALFMAPPVYVQMYNITQDEKFLEFMDKEYRLAYDYLYDKNEYLFYRDHRFFEKREKNGAKVFWGRGNGWVLGGLVKILKELPDSSQYRFFYQKLFVEMCERICTLQDENGYWHSSLLDMQNFPDPETSSSSLFVYAFAYGVNSGLLEKDKYLPIIEKGWKALENAVFSDGKLGWVQQVGGWPVKIEKEMTEAYGVGAFLLAGSEIYSLSLKTKK